MAKTQNEISPRKIKRISHRYRSEVIAVLDLDETVILAKKRLENPEHGLQIEDSNLSLSEYFTLDMHNAEELSGFSVKIINPSKLAGLISHAYENYGGVAFCTSGGWSARTTGIKIANALAPYLEHSVFLRLKKSFVSNPKVDKILFEKNGQGLMRSTSIAYMKKIERVLVWPQHSKHFQTKHMVLFDNDVGHVQSFENYPSKQFSGVVCDAVDTQKQGGCCYQKFKEAMYNSALSLSNLKHASLYQKRFFASTNAQQYTSVTEHQELFTKAFDG